MTMIGDWTRSTKQDAADVIETLEKAKRQAAPLRDPGLVKRIDEAAEHVRRKIDPQKGG